MNDQKQLIDRDSALSACRTTMQLLSETVDCVDWDEALNTLMQARKHIRAAQKHSKGDGVFKGLSGWRWSCRLRGGQIFWCDNVFDTPAAASASRRAFMKTKGID